jgi:hypothetical protein
MIERDHTQDLWEEFNELEQRYKETSNRLEQYYISSNKPGFKQSPHDILRKRAESFVNGGLEYVKNHPLEFGDDREPDPYHIWHLSISFGTEILIKSITLKKDPKWFIENIDDYESPSYCKCKGKFLHILPSMLDSSQRKRINVVLLLLNEQRNHIAHFNLSPQIKPIQSGPVYNVLRFLFSHFWNSELDIVNRLLEHYQDYRQRYDSPPYEIVELP